MVYIQGIKKTDGRKELEVKAVARAFRDRQILSDISFSLCDREYVCITGESGSGKTTLLNIIAGLDKPDHGEVRCGDCSALDPNWRGHVVGYLPCGQVLLESLTVAENIQMAQYFFTHSLFINLEEVCDRFGLRDVMNSYPREISAGEYKRACFARLISLNVPFLLLDEPTSNLDSISAEIIIEELKRQKSRGIIVATHDSRLMFGKEIHLGPP